MTVDRTVEIKAGYIMFAVKGNYLGLAQALDVFKEISELAEEQSTSRILFDITGVKKIPPIMDRYDLGEYAAKSWGHQLKVAIVTKQQLITGFFENVAVNRGAVIKVLSEIKEAEAWLSED